MNDFLKRYKNISIVLFSVIVIISLGFYINIFYKSTFYNTDIIYQLGRIFFYYFIFFSILVLYLIWNLYKNIENLKQKDNDILQLLKIVIENQLCTDELVKKLHRTTQEIMLVNFNEIKAKRDDGD